MKYVYCLLAIMIIVAISIFSLDYWQEQHPLLLEFYDIAFHANATVGMERAGGWTNVNFWAGVMELTPNVYFPFYHMASLLILDWRQDPSFLTYWWSWAMLPLSFITVLLFISMAYGARAGLYSVMLLALSPVWIEKQWGMPPQALVYVLTPLALLAVAKRRYLIAAILTICCAATHFTGLFLVPFLFLYGLQNRLARKPIFITLALLALVGSPFIWFIFQRFEHTGLSVVFSGVRAAVNKLFEVKTSFHVYMGWLAVAGLVVCYRKRKEFLVLPSYFLASFPLAMISPHSMRFWTAPALFIFSLLGGVALGSAHDNIDGSPRKARKICGLLFFVFVFLSANVFFYYASDRYPQTKIPSLAYLKMPGVWQRPGLTIDAQDRDRIAVLVDKYVAEDEFFWIESSNNVNNYMAMRTGRSTVKSITLDKNAMTLNEGIKLVVTREVPSKDYALLGMVDDEYDAYILADPAKAAKVIVPKPIITLRQIQWGFMAMAVLILADLFYPFFRRKRQAF